MEVSQGLTAPYPCPQQKNPTMECVSFAYLMGCTMPLCCGSALMSPCPIHSATFPQTGVSAVSRTGADPAKLKHWVLQRQGNVLGLGLKQVVCNSIFGSQCCPQPTWIVSEMAHKIWKRIANPSTEEKSCQTFCKVGFFFP